MTNRTIAASPEARAQSGRRALTTGRLLQQLLNAGSRRHDAVATALAEPAVRISSASYDRAVSPPGRRWFWFTFFGFVLLPTIAAFCYYAFVASPQYVSEAKFVVRGATQMMPIQGISVGGSAITQVMRLNNNQEGAIISSYIQSEGMLEDLARQVNLMIVYGRPEIDWLSRLPSFHPIEKATRYWQKMVSVQIESVGGILTLKSPHSPRAKRSS